MKYLKRFNENMNLSNDSYINADDDELSFVDEEIRKYLGLPKIELSDDEIDKLSDEDYDSYYDRTGKYAKSIIPGKLEVHGNQVYYDESDKKIMKIMKGIFPNDFRKNGTRIGFAE
jgi:hypothetical protein